MIEQRAGTRGRPPAASREMLQDAAFELFLERGYAGTTVEHITRRAGVSRNTFFNYFEAKGDVLWVELDETLAEFTGVLQGLASDTDALATLRTTIVGLGEQFAPPRMPFVLTQHDLIGSVHELQVSAVTRFTTVAREIRGFLLRSGLAEATAQAIAYAVSGAVVAAARSWAAAGSSRGTLAPYLDAAVTPVLEGFERAER